MNEKRKCDFDIVFRKLSALKESSDEVRSVEEVVETEEINKLREIVLDVAGKDERYFSTV